jgi:hypothetical protein
MLFCGCPRTVYPAPILCITSWCVLCCRESSQCIPISGHISSEQTIVKNVQPSSFCTLKDVKCVLLTNCTVWAKLGASISMWQERFDGCHSGLLGSSECKASQHFLCKSIIDLSPDNLCKLLHCEYVELSTGQLHCKPKTPVVLPYTRV